MRRKAIEENPLDRALPASGNSGEEPAPSPRPEIEAVTFKITSETANRARNAVFWSPGLTMGELAEAALKEAVDRLERKRGEPFPPRQKDLKGGRRVRS